MAHYPADWMCWPLDTIDTELEIYGCVCLTLRSKWSLFQSCIQLFRSIAPGVSNIPCCPRHTSYVIRLHHPSTTTTLSSWNWPILKITKLTLGNTIEVNTDRRYILVANRCTVFNLLDVWTISKHLKFRRNLSRFSVGTIHVKDRSPTWERPAQNTHTLSRIETEILQKFERVLCLEWICFHDFIDNYK